MLENRPARHETCAIFACDAAHLPYAWVAALRIAEVEPDRRFDICIATPDIEALPAACLEGPIRFRRIDKAALPNIAHPNPRISIAAFYRLLLPSILRNDYSTLLYMDTDTRLDRPGIQGLFDGLPADLAISATINFVRPDDLKSRSSSRGRRSQSLLTDLASESGQYFQSGVLVIGTEAYLGQDIGTRVLSYAQERQDMLQKHRLGDQAALNGACADMIVPLSPLWNWHNSRWLRGDLVNRFRPHILHFTGLKKPWLMQDDPFVSQYNAPYFDGLRQIDPHFEPARRDRSVAWLERNPRFGIPAVDALHRRARRGWMGLKHRRLRINESALERMQTMIETAEVG